MRLDQSTFMYVFFIVFAFIIIAHLYLKKVLSEPIFRFEMPKFGWLQNENDEYENDSSDDNEKVVKIHKRGSKRCSNIKRSSRPSRHSQLSPYAYSPYSPFSPASPGSPGWLPNADRKQDLINHIKSNLREVSQIQDLDHKVKGANFYTGYHDSDLHPEETDLSKFFNIYGSVSDTTNMLDKVKCNKGDITCKNPQDPMIDHQSGNPIAFDQGSDGTPMYRRDVWTYDNERVMAGGSEDGILPSDMYQDGYATYPSTNSQSYDNSFESSYPYTQSSGRW